MIFCKEFYPAGLKFHITDHTVTGFNERLQQLHQANAHTEIIKTLEALPPDKMDFDLTGLYARALNNVDQKEKALEVLESIRKEGDQNSLWNWRYGYALFYSERKIESIHYLEKAIELGDDTEEAANLLEMAREYQEKNQI
jgi:tetratricopeptide (TPR) repeat protein